MCSYLAFVWILRRNDSPGVVHLWKFNDRDRTLKETAVMNDVPIMRREKLIVVKLFSSVSKYKFCQLYIVNHDVPNSGVHAYTSKSSVPQCPLYHIRRGVIDRLNWILALVQRVNSDIVIMS